MKHTAAVVTNLLLCLVFLNSSFANSGDPCANAANVVSEARVTLESSRLDDNGVFVGTFRIQNLSKERVLRFNGFSVDGAIQIVRPERSVEYLDSIANEWRPILDLPGTFPPRSNQLVVPPGKTLRFTAPLVTSNVASQSASEFRLLIRSAEPSSCIVSAPFRAYPQRPKVKGFETVKTGP